MNLNEGLNRRSFLKGAALMGGAAAFAGMVGCAPQTSASQELSSTSDDFWDKETDVVIVGAGGGGLASAVEASAAGKEVIVCEVMSGVGMSNSAICAGMIQGACSSVQKDAGVEDTVDGFDKYLAALGEGFENPELRRLYAEKSGETIDWLIEQGAPLTAEGLSASGTMVEYYTDVTPAVPRMHWVDGQTGAAITEPLYKKAVDQGVVFEFETQVLKILTNESDEVIGVRVRNGNKECSIKARLGVILNTSGYTRNPEMIRGYMSLQIPGMSNEYPIIGSYGSPWQKGDGILMASAVGAKLTNMWQCYNVAPGIAIKSEDNKAGLISNPGIYVSTDGKRHVNEARNNRPGGRPTENTMGEIWKQPGGFIWAIWDAAGIEKAGSFLSEGLKDEIASGDIIEADSLEALAAVIEVDPETLKQTVEEYNANIIAGTDPLGRVEGEPLTEAPFYAAHSVGVTPDTAGGVCVNTNTQVISVFEDQIIPRLYAVGNMVGGFKGKVNAGCGQALGWIYTSGRIAGQHVVTLEPLA